MTSREKHETTMRAHDQKAIRENMTQVKAANGTLCKQQHLSRTCKSFRVF